MTATDASKANKSIFFVTLPKSGTVFTWQTLEAMTGLKQPNLNADKSQWKDYASGLEYRHETIYASGDFATQRLLPHRLGQFLPNGYIFGAHMPPVYHNMQALEVAGVNRIVVTLRDPRDATVSWAHHVEGRGDGYRNYQSKIYSLPFRFFDLPYEDQLAFHVRNFLPMAVTWIEAWLDFYANPSTNVDILFVYYDDLKSNPIRYFDRIHRFLDLGQMDEGKIPHPEKGKMHYRQGKHGSWFDEFSQDDKSLSDLLMGDRILASFAKASKSRINAIDATAEMLPASARLNLALDALDQFPTSVEIARTCADLARSCAAPASMIGQFQALADTRHDSGSIFQTPAHALAAIEAARNMLATQSA